ncbi:uncharacterized protein METZ01_LOCUS128962, partial [marine metagenome]
SPKRPALECSQSRRSCNSIGPARKAAGVVECNRWRQSTGNDQVFANSSGYSRRATSSANVYAWRTPASSHSQRTDGSQPDL